MGNEASVDVVRCGASPDMEDALVLASLDDDAPLGGVGPAVDALNSAQVAIVQHEYGLYDGSDGDAVLDVMSGLTVPTIVVAHTVVGRPTENQRTVLESVCAAADAVVVMTSTARARLLAGFDVDPGKVLIIPHGAATPPPVAGDEVHRPRTTAPRLLTWGLLGPGKGIEWAIDALADLADLDPAPEYLIAGATHPKVLAYEGDTYRQMLVERVASTGTTGVTFDDSYRDLETLTELIRSADLVVLPYDSADQVTSGVLVDAVAAGCPVVSTAFPHAVELLGSGAGIVVPQRDPKALAAAIRAVVTDPELAAGMAAEARRLAPGLSWYSVAGQYHALAGQLLDSVRS